MQKVIIDYSKFPVIQNRISGFYQIGQERINALKNFNQVQDRIAGIMRFLFHFSPENDLVVKRAYLRAALSEFVSIEEILENDLNENAITANPLKINVTQNPLFHILKQLRNYNVHLGYSRIDYSDPIRVIMGSEALIEKGEAFEYDEEFAIIENFNIDEFNNLRDANRYEDKDKEAMVNWFNMNQRPWGVSHLIFLATLLYCDDIIYTYKLN